MALTEFERIAPRLARAHSRELAYQATLAEQRRRGYFSMGIAAEEMLRGTRAFLTLGWEFQRQTLALQRAAGISPAEFARIQRAITALRTARTA